MLPMLGNAPVGSPSGAHADLIMTVQVDLLPEIKVPPNFRPPTSEMLPLGLAAEVDSYLATRQPASFLAGLKQRLTLSEHEYAASGYATGYGTKYNVELLNSLVFYVGIKVQTSHLPAFSSTGSGTLL